MMTVHHNLPFMVKDFPDHPSTMYSQKSFTMAIKVRDVPTDDLYSGMGPLLKFGSILGICPYGGLWKKSYTLALTYRRASFAGVVNIIIMIAMGINVLMNIAGMCTKIMAGETSPIKLAWAMMPPLFYIVGMHTYISFASNAKDLILILSNWRTTFSVMTYTRDDLKSVRKARFWGSVVMISAILENAIYHMRQDCSQTNCSYLKHVKDPSKLSIMEEYYLKEHGVNWCGLPYSPFITAMLFVVNKLSVMATNYADVAIFTMGWALGSKFQHFYEEVKLRMEDQSISWHQARKDFIALVRLLQQIQNFLSPMIFTSYTLLLELISTQIHLGITTDTAKTVFAKVYSIWSFLHLIVRLLLMSVVCSRITDRCNDVLLLLHKCPVEKYSSEVERLERLVTAPMGLGGLGCFRITRPFILSVLYVIFTCEIIFLQTSQHATAS